MNNAYLLLLFVVGCTAQTVDLMEEKIDPDSEHLGCQEGELVEGQCSIAVDNNAGIFDADTSNVETMDLEKGFLAKPTEPGNYPGIIMIHEWWGLNDNIKEMARILASEGYVVYAVDLYDGQVATDSSTAGPLATSVRGNPDKALTDMRVAIKYLQEQENVQKIASIGWCFGGQQSLLLSLNEELDATVIYYGQLVDDPAQLGKMKWPVLGIFGEEDQSITVESVRKFESALNDLGIENEITIYPGVGHAFANPSGSNYADKETKDAWDKTLEFLNNLKSDEPVEEDEVMSDAHIYQFEGTNFKFTQSGVNNPEIRIKEGDTIRIELTVTEGFHDWVVDEFDAATERIDSGTTTIEFVADKKGTFEYYCSVGNHRAQGMKGVFIVE